MTDKPLSPAIAGWHTTNAEPHLIGTRCRCCNTFYFPKEEYFCGNPNCDSTEFEEVELSRTGHIWSYTNACYKPPAPFVSGEPFEPFTIAAVQLDKEQMIVLGQVVSGVAIEKLEIGMPVELVVETLHETEEDIRVTWKWRPKTSTT